MQNPTEVKLKSMGLNIVQGSVLEDFILSKRRLRSDLIKVCECLPRVLIAESSFI